MMRLSIPRIKLSIIPSSPLRHFSSSLATLATPVKSSVPIALISKIRSLRPGTPMSLARTALQSSGNDLDIALKWLSDQAAKSGAAKAEKLSGRAITDGLIGVILENDGLGLEGANGIRGAMVEIGCETDFVARTEEFRTLVEGVTRSLSFFADGTNLSGRYLKKLELENIKDIPMLPPLTSSSTTNYSATNEHSKIETISTAIAATVSRLGENISLKRALSINIEPSSVAYLASTFSHGGTKSAVVPGSVNLFESGTLASLLLLKLPGGETECEGLKMILRALARQVVAVPTDSVTSSTTESSLPITEGGEVSTALYDQPIMTMASSPSFEFESGATVKTVLEQWSKAKNVQSLEVVELERWELGGDKSE